MEIRYTLELDDHEHFYRYVFRRQLPWFAQAGAVALCLLPAAYAWWRGTSPITSPAAIFGIFLVCVLWFARRDALRLPLRQPPLCEERTVRIGPSGIMQETQSGVRSEKAWSELIDIARDPQCIYLFDTPQNAYVIPLRAFSDRSMAEEFFAMAKQYWLQARA